MMLGGMKRLVEGRCLSNWESSGGSFLFGLFVWVGYVGGCG